MRKQEKGNDRKQMERSWETKVQEASGARNSKKGDLGAAVPE